MAMHPKTVTPIFHLKPHSPWLPNAMKLTYKQHEIYMANATYIPSARIALGVL